MKRTVNREPIDAWIDKNYPDAITKLAVESEVPANTLNKIRLGYVPKNEKNRKKLAKVLGETENRLFPLVEDEAG